MHDSIITGASHPDSCLVKILDHSIAENYNGVFETSCNQFWFKLEISTTQCTSEVKEVIRYYTNSDSNVYTVMLDATKAFD